MILRRQRFLEKDTKNAIYEKNSDHVKIKNFYIEDIFKK